ncbi:MAG: hypothetical protein ABJO86_13135 [Lentilitoribacter sp.]
MNEEPPQSELIINTSVFEFDVDTLTVTESTTEIARNLLQKILNSRSKKIEVYNWLQSWALWMDRENELALRVVDDWRSEPYLRVHFGGVTELEHWDPPWIRIELLPEFPSGNYLFLKRFKFVAGISHILSRSIWGYRRKFHFWLDQENLRWDSLRESANKFREIEQTYQERLNMLKFNISHGQNEAEISKAVREVLIQPFKQLNVVEVEFLSDETFRLVIEHDDVEESLSSLRHEVLQDLSGLEKVKNAETAQLRFQQIAFIMALIIADLVMYLRSNRRKLDIEFLPPKGAQELHGFGLKFNADEMLSYNNEIKVQLTERKAPSIRGCEIYQTKSETND